MESRAKLFGHAIHPILIVFPLGLFSTAVFFDVVYLLTGNGRWADISFWMIAGGIIGGLSAAVFGLVDLLAIPQQTRAQTVALWHGGTNVVVLILFGVSWLLRRNAPTRPEMIAIVPAFAGAALSVVGGWLGGELVERLGVGVHEGAHPDAPSSLSNRPASGDVKNT